MELRIGRASVGSSRDWTKVGKVGVSSEEGVEGRLESGVEGSTTGVGGVVIEKGKVPCTKFGEGDWKGGRGSSGESSMSREVD